MRVQTNEPLSDAAVREKLVTYLKRHGPSRGRTMTKSLRAPYERSLKLLEAMLATGEVEQVPGGTHRGHPVLAWCMAGDARAHRKPSTRHSFGGEVALLAMQQAARATLEARA